MEQQCGGRFASQGRTKLFNRTRGANKTSWPGWTQCSKRRGRTDETDTRCWRSVAVASHKEGLVLGPFVALRALALFFLLEAFMATTHLENQVSFGGEGVRKPSIPAVFPPVFVLSDSCEKR